MKKYVDGVYMDATSDEVLQAQQTQAEQEYLERRRPLTEPEILSMLLRQQINTLSVDDQTALRMLDYYPTWESLTGTEVAAGTRLTCGGKLYKVLQAHTVSTQWVPGVGTESLYTHIDEEHEGDRYDPIPYEGNMELEQGKYYSQGGVVYLCTRSTGQPVYHTLAELIGLYVEVVRNEF